MRRVLLITSFTLLISNIIFAQEPKLMLPIGHTGLVFTAAYSPDGQYIISASIDGTAKLWNAINGQLVIDLKAHKDYVTTASFSPDGKYIVTASYDKTAKLWNAQDGQLVADLKGHTNDIYNASYSPDGKYIVTASADRTAKVWNAKDGQLVADLKGHSNRVWNASFSPNGKYVLSESEDSTAKLWNTISGQLVATFKGQNGLPVTSFSPDGKYIVTASRDSTIKIWNTVNGQLVSNLNGHRDYVYNVSYSPDGKYIVTFSKDSTAKVWGVTDGKLVADLKVQTNLVYSALYSPDGKYIVTTSRDSTAKIWNTVSGQLVTILKGHRGSVYSALYSPDGKYIVTASRDSTAKVWNAVSGQLVANLQGNKKRVTSAFFSPDGKHILTRGDNSLIIEESEMKVWNPITGQLVTVLKGHTQGIASASFSPDGEYIVTISGSFTLKKDGGNGDHTAVKVWNAANGQLLADLKGHTREVSSASFSPNGKYIVTASNDSTAKVWNTISGKLVATLKGHTSYVNNASFSPDGKYIVTYSGDSNAKIWDAISGQLVATLKGRTGYFLPCASFSSDGNYIVTTSYDSTARVWNPFSGKLVATLKGHTSYVNNASFSPDGKYIVTASGDSTAKVWNTANGQLVTDLKGHTGYVNNASFSPDGKYVVTVSMDNTAKVWNTANGQLVANLKGHIGYVRSASFSLDGKYIVTLSMDNTAKVWDAVSWQLIKTIEGNNGYFDKIDFNNRRITKVDNSEVSIYDLESGKRLYTFFAMDTTDYLVYDKDNRYDGTPAARKLLYFTCGTEIIELDQLKDQLWVPNLAERIMNGETINAQKLSDLNICNLTPVVDTIEQTALQYRFQITPRLGGLGATIVYVNGIEIKRYTGQQLIKQKDVYQLAIDKKELQQFFTSDKENSIVVKALTAKNSISSRSASISEKGKEITSAAPDLYAIVVGVSDYKGDGMDLKFAAKDAVDIGNAIDASAKKLLNTDGKEHVFIYKINTAADRDQFPEKNSIKQAFTEIAAKAKTNDILLVFFAGHGVMEAEKKQFYFLTADASNATVSVALKDVGISTDELTEWIKPQVMKAQKRILIFDACNSGQAIKEMISIGKKDQNFLAARGDDKGNQIKAIEKLNERSGMFILSASASDQKAYEMGKYNQGALTYSLLKAIKEEPGILEDRKYLNISRWFNAAEKTVGELSRETGTRQQPQIVSTTNFNIGVVDEEVRNKIVLPFEKPMFTRSDFRNISSALTILSFGP